MNTTVEIPDELAQQAARDGGTSLRDLVVTGLRHELERRGAERRAGLVFPTFRGEGFQDGAGPGDLIRLAYED